MRLWKWWTGRGPSKFMKDSDFGPLDHVTLYAVRDAPQQPDVIGWTQPASFGRAYQGGQLHNGVSQLEVAYETPTASDVPYWQQQQRVNPPQSTRFGGPAKTPMGPVQVATMRSDSNAGKPVVATGIGTLYRPGEL